MKAEAFLRDIEARQRLINAMMDTAGKYFRISRRAGTIDDGTIKAFVDLASLIQRESATLYAQVETAREMMARMDNERAKLFIELRYFQGLKIQSVMNAMHCSRSSVHRIQREALAEVQALMDAGEIGAQEGERCPT